MLASVAAATALAGCGGGGDGSGGAVTACLYSYSLTPALEEIGVDPLIASQWHLPQVRAQQAWVTTRGEGVRVAVVDDAVELVHEDLRPNVVDGASYSYRNGNRGSPWPLPCQEDDDHGTAVAGILLARDDNNKGGAGVAPRASLVAFDALSNSTAANIADALRRDSGLNSIYQNSWGAPDTGALQPLNILVFDTAIREGARYGRGGLGSVYLFPAGNGGQYSEVIGTKGKRFLDNANYDGYVNRLGVNTICAVDDSDRAPFYAEPGANLLVCAPGSAARGPQVVTTDLESRYRSDFSGTSASTPIVSGVAALMLAARPPALPALSWRDVRWILATSATRNHSTDAGWKPAPGLGPDRSYNHYYGFGLVNAEAAVNLAKTWQTVGGWDAMQACGPYQNSPSLALEDPKPPGTTLQPRTDALTVAASTCAISQVEFVEIRFTAAHTDPGDLRIHLTSPSGTTSELADARACGTPGATIRCNDYDDWQFGSVRHLGEQPLGQWTLTVTDMVAGDVGTFVGWSIRLYGR